MDYKQKRELGQVFTEKQEVKAIIELLSDTNYASRVMEPGCGTGNFLIEIYEKKIESLKKMPEVKLSLKSNFIDEFEYKFIISISSVYGVDLDGDVIDIARKRCSEYLLNKFLKLTKIKEIPEHINNAIDFLMKNNLIVGDLINSPEKIKILEYNEVTGLKIKIREFIYEDLIFPEDEVFEKRDKLFAHIPLPRVDYDPIIYRELGNING